MEDFRRTSACGVFNDPKLFPIPSHEAMRIVYDIRRIDTYGDSSVIACLTYSEAAQLVENYAAAQRQAGRDEREGELEAMHEAWCDDIKERYAALVEEVRDVVGNDLPLLDGLRKALHDLDGARKG